MVERMPLLRLVSRLALVAVLAAATLTTSAGPQLVAASNPVTPGPISGYGFDQCEAPSQAAMTAWRKHSPFRAAGIYISGKLRFCQEQTNLTPEWVRTQLAAGWRLLPLHVGRQASCTTRERYLPMRISADPTNNYVEARKQGRAEGKNAVYAARALGIRSGSTLYYDLEAFDATKTKCRESALWFLGAWTNALKEANYVSGVYSSAASGIKALDDQRVTPGNPIPMPHQIWIAEWNNERTVQSDYVRDDGWRGRRIHQYRGGHDETYGGYTINIDSNILDLHGFPTCDARSVNRSTYRLTTPDIRRDLVTPLQCMLKKNGYYPNTVTGAWNTSTTYAVKAFQEKVMHPQGTYFKQGDWVALLVAGTSRATIKVGSTGPDVVRAQRALNAAGDARLAITGTFDSATYWATKSYQKAVGVETTGAIGSVTWRYLSYGKW